MSLDEQPTRSLLSGTSSMWSHCADQSSGTSVPVINSFLTPTLCRPSATNSANGVLSPSHAFSHRQSQSQYHQNLGTSQKQSPTSGAAGTHIVQVGYLDKGDQIAVSSVQSARKLGSAAIPIVRPSPASQATVGAIGDGRKRMALGNINHSDVPASAEAEQTAALLRSLNFTPPVQYVDSFTTTPAYHAPIVERPRLHIDPYGQYSNSVGLPYPRRSPFDPFSDSADTPTTQSPATPSSDHLDLSMGFNPLTPFDVNEGGFLLRHTSQEALDKPYPFLGTLSRALNPSLRNGTTIGHPPPTFPLSSPNNGSSLDMNAAQLSQALFSRSYGSHDSSSSLPPNLNALSMPSASSLNAESSNPVNTSAAQHISHDNSFTSSKDDMRFFHLHEPAPYPRSPSPYWKYFSTSESESLPQIPLGAMFGDMSMKQDGWVASLGSNQELLKPDEKKVAPLPATNARPGDASWSSGIAPWSSQQSQSGERLSQSQSMGISSLSGHSNGLVIRPMGSISHASHAPTSHLSSVQRHGVPGSSGMDFHPAISETLTWAQATDTKGSHAVYDVSPPKAFLPIRSNVNANHPNIPAFLPSFASTPTPGPDSRIDQLIPQTQNLDANQARTVLSQSRFGGLHLEEDENINFLQLLQPDAKPPYNILVNRIVRKSDQQASIFIQQKLKNASAEERSRIVDAIVERALDMMHGRFGNWCVQRCLEGPCSRENRMKIVECMNGHVVELATNCYGTHVVQKALECEEDIKRIIVNELLDNDPAFTLTSKHCSHVWAKVMELSWHEGPAPPIFRVVNQSLRGKWASLACHETGSLVVQTMFENMDEVEDKRIIVDEILDNLDDVVKNQWGAFVIQHIIEHGNAAVSHRTSLSLINNMAAYGTHDIAVKSILKILKEKNPLTQDAAVTKMCEPNINSNRNKRPIVVDLALSSNGSQIIQAILPDANKDQRARLYDAVKGHTVTLRGCKTGSRVIWLFDRMRAYYGY